jgi:hypothetical protein
VRPLRHGYTNDSRTDGATVLKRYVGPLGDRRRDTERTVLGRLPDDLPVPRVLDAPPGALRLPHLPGVPGQELIDAGHAAPVLHSCGALLRRVQQCDTAQVFPGAAAGTVLAHGDFGPNNMLLDPATFAVTALVDWEWAHPGDPVEDLAWCEWIVRMHHPAHTGALGHLFAGYGDRPPWPARRAAAVARCHELADMVRQGPDAEARSRRWRERAEITAAWPEQPP